MRVSAAVSIDAENPAGTYDESADSVGVAERFRSRGKATDAAPG